MYLPATNYLEESKGFYETCKSFTLARVCQTPVGGCEQGWTLVSGTNRCYKYFSDKKSYADAETACSALEGHLSSVHSQTENEAIVKFAEQGETDAQSTDTKPFLWIGLKVAPLKSGSGSYGL